MCDPISAGLALSAAGGGVKAYQNNQLQKRTNAENKRAFEASQSARKAEQARQQGFTAEQMGVWDGALTGAAPEAESAGRAKSVADFLALHDEAPTAPVFAQLSGQNNAAGEIQADIAARTNRAAADARARVQALAKLSSYGSNNQATNIGLGQSGDQIGTIGGFQRGSLGTSRLETNIGPATVRPGSTMLADILSGAGAVVSGMGTPTGMGATPWGKLLSPASAAAVSAGRGGLY